MLRLGQFGIKQTLDLRFDEKHYHHNTKENIILRLQLQELANEEEYLTYNIKVSEKFKEIQKDKTTNLSILKFNIERLQDLARCLSYCVPKRTYRDSRFRYELDKIARRTIQLDIDIAKEIIELQRQVILFYQKNTNLVKIKLADSIPNLIDYETAFKVDFVYEPKKEAKKRRFFSWLK